MRKLLLMGWLAAALSIAMVPASAETAAAPGAYANVNGIRMYYEEHGPKTGVPLVLLHGGGSTIDVTFGRVLPFLARSHRIIAVEEQGHGRTSGRDAPVRFETSADDVARCSNIYRSSRRTCSASATARASLCKRRYGTRKWCVT